ncbi:MAG: SMP-30/gluconolactonase/LRE family protein [Alphaproteobacteria bacterium]|nr:SMP-30/gluconolactonase/LRE family protein [Alphaproteobacteria bacterium]
MQATLKTIIPVGNILGEGIICDPRLGQVWWTDIHAAKLYALEHGAEEPTVYDLPERLGSLGLTDDPHTLICAFASGFYLYKPASGERTLVVETNANTPGVRLNDGRLDREGRFWAGSMVENAAIANGLKGTLYSLERGVLKTHMGGIRISNGLAWNKAGTRMYFADTPTGAIKQMNYDPATGCYDNETIFAAVDAPAGADGATVDSEDHYWSAHWGTGQVVRYRPDGSIACVLEVPDAAHVACVEFGGPDMNHLYVSTARWEMDGDMLASNPLAGHLFVYETDVKGVAQKKFYGLN